MSTREQLDSILAELKKRYSPLEVFEESRTLLKEASRKGAEWDPLDSDDKAAQGRQAYMDVANALEKRGYFAASAALLLEWWDDFGLRQRQEKKRVYRAVIGFMLAQHYLRTGDKGAALRWLLHTQADDMLGRHGAGGGAGKQQLRTIFGMSQSDLEQLNSLAEQCRQEVGQHGDDWSQPAAFPEEVVRRFAQQEGTSTHLLAEAPGFREFPVSRGYCRAMLDRVDSARSAEAKGDSLEDLAYYVLLLLPGCVPRRNVLDVDLVGEWDIVVRNLNSVSNLTAELLGRHFLVECKNWADPVNVGAVGYFLHRMRLAHASFGIIFSKKGITGDKDGKAARALIRRSFHEDGNVCVVVKGEDLTKLAEGDIGVWWMLLEKIESLRFGKPRPTTWDHVDLRRENHSV